MSSAAEAFRHNVLAEIKKQNLTMAHLARKLKISQPALSTVLSGKEKVTIDRAERIATALGMPLFALLSEKFEIAS